MNAKEAIEWTRIRLSNLRAEEMEKHSDTSACCRAFYTQPNRDKDLAALAVLSALAEENDRLRAESNGKHWQGIAQIAALQTENAALKAERDEWRDKAMFQQGRADEAMKICHVNPNCKDASRCNPHGEFGPVTHRGED